MGRYYMAQAKPKDNLTKRRCIVEPARKFRLTNIVARFLIPI